MKKTLLILIALFFIALPGYSQINDADGLRMPGDWNSFTNTLGMGGDFDLTLNQVGTRRWETLFQFTGTSGSQNFKFASGGSGATWFNQWANIQNVQLNSLTQYPFKAQNEVGPDLNNSTISLTQNKYYKVIWKDVGYATTSAIFLETTNAPVEITSVSGYTGAKAADAGVTISVELSATPSPEEKIFIRYSTDNFQTSTPIEVTGFGAGTSGSAEIPGQADLTTVTFYVLSTTVASENWAGDPDMITINLNNNSGSNYSYQVGNVLSLSAPSNNATNQARATTLSWFSVDGAASYEVQVTTDEDFTAPTFTSTPTDTFVVLDPALAAKTTYKWRVRVGGDTPGEWSSVRNFTTQASVEFANVEAPDPNSVEEGNTVSISGRVYMENVTSIAGATEGLQVWVGVNSADTDPSTWDESAWTLATFAEQAGINNNDDRYSASVGSDLAVGTYFSATRFKYLEDGFVYGGQSTEGDGGFWGGDNGNVSFSIVAPPNGPTLGLPENNATNQARATKLSWFSVDGAASYEVQVTTDEDFSTPTFTSAPTDTFVVVDPALAAKTTYKWRVRVGGDSPGEWSSVRMFTTQASVEFANVEEPNPNSVEEGNTVTISGRVYMENVTSIAGATEGLQVWVGVNAADTDPSTWDESTWTLATFAEQAGINNNDDRYSVSLGSDLTVGTYFSATRLKYLEDGFVYGGQSTEGDGGFWGGDNGNVSFSIVAPPNGPTLGLPEDNATNQARATTLSWFSVDGTASYEVQVTTDEDFSTPTFTSTPTDTFVVVDPALAAKTSYKWRVRIGGDTPGEWSSVRMFTTQASVEFANVEEPNPNSVEEGNTVTISGRVYMENITSIAGATEGLQVWVGVNSADTDPSTWDESAWTLATFAEQAGINNNDDRYSVSLGSDLAVGTYFSATRLKYLEDGFVYGGQSTEGDGGFWGGDNGNVSFSIVAPPNGPTLGLPEDNATNQARETTLSWFSVDGAASYEVQVTTDEDFTTPTFTSAPTDTFVVVDPALAAKTTYKWRVRIGGATPGDWSTVQTFTTQPSIEFANIENPNPTSIEEGESITIGARAYMESITNQEGSTEGLQVWVGVHTENSDPSTWHDSVWTVAPYVGQAGINNNDDRFSISVGLDLPIGTYFAASRFKYLSDDYVYGGRSNEGDGGFWGGENGNASFSINEKIEIAQTQLVSPANESLENDASIALIWDKVELATLYDVQYGLDAAFENSSPVMEVSDTTTTISDLDFGLTYYWRVKAKNGEKVGEWSVPLSFTVKLNPTIKPIIHSPKDTLVDAEDNVTFTWIEFENASSYSLEINNISENKLWEIDEIDSNSIEIDSLAIGKSYSWRVRAEVSEQYSPWSDPALFSTLPEAPGATLLASPSDDDVNVSVSATLRWFKSAHANKYQVQLSPSITFETKLDSVIADSSLRVTGLLHEQTYFWSVRSGNEKGWGPWSDTLSFTTIIQAPEAPEALLPTPDFVVTADSVSVTWGSIRNADTYEMELSSDPSFESLHVRASELTDTSIVVRELNDQETYYWRVRASNISGSSEWSEIIRFSTAIPTSVIDEIPTQFVLEQNYPNPFNPSTTIRFSLPQAQFVRLEVFTLTGQKVVGLIDNNMNAGVHSVTLDASSLSSGVYLYRLVTEKFTASKRFTLIK